MKEQSKFKIITPSELENYHGQTEIIAEESWPQFMLHDPVAGEHWHELFDRFEEYQFALLDIETNRMAAMGNSVPFHWEHSVDELPEGGWDWVFVKAVEDHKKGVTPTIQSAIQVAIHPDYQGQGLSAKMVQAMRGIAKSKGFKDLVAPVRPSQKSQYPLASIDDYIKWTNDKDLPFDSWLRVHARARARIIKPCHEAMKISGTVTTWEAWTEMKFPQSGEYIIPGALNPVTFDIEKDEGVYIEPNVWMHHSIG